ncbi:hypothetical protein BC831DRAFT_472271 [Entophlyctis helioformis]|nr:hypothetical protein BC831DRAFT_472271 [Entophlyctis helioformis]
MCSFQLEAAGYGSPPPALQAALGPASASFVRDGRGLYRHSAIEIHKTDTRRCSCGGGKVMTSLDSGVSLVLGKESVKTVLNLHNAIARGRTGAGFVGCLDGQRVAIKGVSFTFYDNTNYQAIRKETLFYDKHKDLQGDAIPLVVEAVVSRDCAFLVMELGQSCQSWSDADRSLAAHALSKLHARHILHGDLHSGNVVFVGQGDERKARIIDLESAREYRGQDFGELAAREMARVVRFGTATEYDRKHGE